MDNRPSRRGRFANLASLGFWLVLLVPALSVLVVAMAFLLGVIPGAALLMAVDCADGVCDVAVTHHGHMSRSHAVGGWAYGYAALWALLAFTGSYLAATRLMSMTRSGDAELTVAQRIVVTVAYLTVDTALVGALVWWIEHR